MTATTYTIDLLTADPTHTEDHSATDLDAALDLALEFYYEVAGDDAEHVVGVWTQDYQLVAIIFAAQIFVPQQT